MISLRGKPLIFYTLDSLKNSSFYNDSTIICSSDDQIILDYADTCLDNLILHKRSPSLSKDTSSLHELIISLSIEYNFSQPYDICILQPTSPLRTAEDIDAAFTIYSRNQSKSLVSVSNVNHTAIPEKILVLNKHSDKLEFFDKKSMIKRRQDYTTSYFCRNSAIYIVNSSKIHEGLIFDNSDYYEMPNIRSIDVDTIEDLEMAKILLASKV